MGKQPKRKLIHESGMEADVHSNYWRRLIQWKRGETAAVKRNTNRKERRDNERQSRDWKDEY